MILRRPIIIFLLVITSLITSAAFFIQSKTFAGLVRGFLSNTVPKELGVSIEFSEFKLQGFPPAISIRDPELKLSEHNFLGVPRSSVFKAKRLDLVFKLFQFFSGKVQIEQVRLLQAEIVLQLEQKRRAQSSSDFSWAKLVQIKLNSVALEESSLKLEWPKEKMSLAVDVSHASASRLENSDGSRFAIQGKLRRVEGLKESHSLRLFEVEANANIAPSGVTLNSIKASTDPEDQQTVIQASGKILGDILSPSSLKTQLHLQLIGKVADLRRWFFSGLRSPQVFEAANQIEGSLQLNGDWSGDLMKLGNSAVFLGKGSLSEGSLFGWRVKNITSELKLRLAESSSVALELDSAKAVAPDGGSLAIGKSSFIFSSSGLKQVSKIPIELNRARLEWLVGPYSSTVDNLESNYSGKGDLSIQATPRLSIRAELGLTSEGLDLFSGGGSARKRSRILSAGPQKIGGSILIQSGKFIADKLRWSFDRSSFAVSGDVDWSGSGIRWNLTASGPANLRDLRELGGSKIEGEGSLTARVHGESDQLAVDFDADLNQASYLQMSLGRFQGKLSLVEGQSLLRFHEVQGKKGETPYSVSGEIDFREDGRLELGVRFPGGQVEDVSAIFRSFTSSFAWYPHSVRGRLRGTARVFGGLGMHLLKVESSLQGLDWSYLGERFRSVQFKGGYNQGEYYLRDLQIRKRSGTLTGGVSLDAKENLNWNLSSTSLSLRDFDWILRTGLPLRGDLQISSSGSGKIGSLESLTEVSLENTVVRSRQYGASSLKVSSKEGLWNVTGAALGNLAQLKWRYDRRPQASNELKILLESADFSPLLLLLNPKNAQDQNLEGSVSGALELTYFGSDFSRASGKVSLKKLRVAKSGTLFAVESPIIGQVIEGDLTVPEITLLSKQGSMARVRVGSRKGFLSCNLSGQMDLSLLELITPWVQRATGRIDLDLRISGDVLEPKLSGKLDIREGVVRLTVLESELQNLQGRVSVRNGKLLFTDFHADLAQGRASAFGQVEIFPNRLPAVDLKANFSENRLKFYPFQFIKIRSANLRVFGDSIPYEISGGIQIDQALSREKLSGPSQGGALKTSVYEPNNLADPSFDYPKFRLKIDALADSGLLFQNEFMDVEMRAAVTVVNTVESPGLLGKAEFIPGQGKITFKDHVFQLQSGLVKFTNPMAISPAFDVLASAEVKGTKVQLYTTGSGERFKVELSSNPVLPEAEILSLLAMGRTLEESQRLRAGSTSGVQQSEAASLILNTLDFNREVREKTGFQVGVGEAVDVTSGVSAFRPQSDVESTVAPKLILKREIGKRVDVSVGSTVGAGTLNQREVNADFYVSPALSIRGVWNFWEGSTTQDTSVLQQSRTSYGLDFKLQKRFK